ncbi:MAG: PhzF family phenazine biosynthesis protein [Thermoactinospora sp.]|nr:PhzF family phenazine biosynthesis protein [Thermoactinospora sp.]
MRRPFQQVDVFTDRPYFGNALAVVLDGTGLSTDEMARFARWTNLSETTFLLPPRHAEADYLVRIFTPAGELPFAGHPTLGSCHAWLLAGGMPKHTDVVVQECGAGLVQVRRFGHSLAFAAPPLVRSGPVEPELAAEVMRALGVEPGQVVDMTWADNGPGWVAVELGDAEQVLALEPHFVDQKVGVVAPHLDLGVVGRHAEGAQADFEVRAFFPVGRELREDPVTGSLNASVAQWLLGKGRARAPYTVRQGTALGRDGRVTITADADGTIWVGGDVVTCVSGEVEL